MMLVLVLRVLRGVRPVGVLRGLRGLRGRGRWRAARTGGEHEAEEVLHGSYLYTRERNSVSNPSRSRIGAEVASRACVVAREKPSSAA